jgi:signal transduction histidine kinase
MVVAQEVRMSIHEAGLVGAVRVRARIALEAVEHLVGGLGTAILALFVLLWTVAVAFTCLVGIGLVLAPTVPVLLRTVADRERGRLSRWGPAIIAPDPVPTGLRDALADPTLRRELRWLVRHATLGLVIGVIGVALPLDAVRDGTFPLWWRLVPPEGRAPWFWTVHDLAGALGIGLLGVVWLTMAVGLGPAMARWQARAGRQLLAPPPDADLSLRITQLTATRAAALDAHATELRRIERSLHDGTQNRLVAVTVLLGAARRALVRNPSSVEDILNRAQNAAEQALAELRSVARGILPPVLADRGLSGALAGLASSCGVPCRIDVDVPGRCAASVEATAYFVVAEALTNVSRHSGAKHATVAVRRRGDQLYLEIGDDGHGGADEHDGSGITGIRQRIEAFDGRLTLTSPPGGPTTFQVELPCGS